MDVGGGELDQEKLKPLLRLMYHNSIADAIAALGPAEEIGSTFASFIASRALCILPNLK